MYVFDEVPNQGHKLSMASMTQLVTFFEPPDITSIIYNLNLAHSTAFNLIWGSR